VAEKTFVIAIHTWSQPPRDMIHIDGDWIGFYTYDKGYSQLTKLDTIPFRATIKREFENFVGRIIEEEDFGGIEDEILIKGN
jgi:hypothetical protein